MMLPFPDRVPWYVVGPLMGIVVVLVYALLGKRLGVSGSYTQVRMLVLGRTVAEPWRIWFLVGIVGGATLTTLLRGGSPVGTDYGALGRLLPIGVIIPILFAGGALIGFGARWAEGCTSGHGLAGIPSRSPASFAAAATFFATAVGVTFLVHVVTGGVL
jgi:uncharacterized membrane protein YedE/YeeE